MLDYIVMQMRKTNREKGYCDKWPKGNPQLIMPAPFKRELLQ